MSLFPSPRFALKHTPLPVKREIYLYIEKLCSSTSLHPQGPNSIGLQTNLSQKPARRGLPGGTQCLDVALTGRPARGGACGRSRKGRGLFGKPAGRAGRHVSGKALGMWRSHSRGEAVRAEAAGCAVRWSLWLWLRGPACPSLQTWPRCSSSGPAWSNKGLRGCDSLRTFHGLVA